MNFKTYTLEDSPEAAKPLLEQVIKDYGFIPNLYGSIAESPPVLEGMMSLADIVAKTSLSPGEIQIVYLAVSYENDCSYCVSGHSGVAKMIDVPDDVVAAIRAGKDIEDPKLNTLSKFSKNVLHSKGWIDDDALKAFLAAGYTKANVFDVVLIISQKVLSNYAGHLTNVEVDEAFMSFKWEK